MTPEPGQALALLGDDLAELLESVAAQAVARGRHVLTVTGVPAEADVPYAALDRLLRPLLTGSAQRPIDEALVGEHTDRRVLRIALAVLDLLESDTLLIAGEAQWLDEESWQVLTFAGRRLTGQSLLLGMRDGAEAARRLDDSGLRPVSLGPDTLERTARQQEERGDTPGAFVTWERAAALAVDPARRTRDRFRAVVCASDAGAAQAVPPMIALLDAQHLTDRDQLWLTWHNGGAGADIEVTNLRLLAFAQVSDENFDIVGEVVLQLFYTPLEVEVREAVTGLAQRDDARGIALLALAAPLENGKEVRAALPRFLSTARLDAPEQTDRKSVV